MYKGRLFSVKQLSLKVDGKPYGWDYIEGKSDAVVVIPFLDKDTVLLERQHRRAVRKYIYELPAGKIEDGEPPEKCVERELEEETGYIPRKIEFLFKAHTSPAWHTETINYYKASKLEKGKRHLDATEEITVEKVRYSKLLEMIKAGEIIDNKTIALALYYDRFVKPKKS